MTRPIEAATAALDRTGAVLFQPFDAGKYLAIAFCAWLYHLGGLAGNMTGGPGSPGVAEWNPASFDQAVGFVQAHAPWIILAAVGALLVGLTVWVALAFLQSRGSFMLIDNIVHRRGEVIAPWKTWSPQANDLFSFRLFVGIGAGVVSLLALTAAAAGAWSIWDGAFSPPLVGVLAVGGLSATMVSLTAAIALGAVEEWVVPLMYARGYGVRDGIRDLIPAVRADLGGFARYLVVRVAAAIAVGIFATMAAVLTCGAAMLPFVGTLVLLPALVFVRAYSLEFAGQLSDDLYLALHPELPPPPDQPVTLPFGEPEASPA